MYIDEYKIYTLISNEFLLPERLDSAIVFDFTGKQHISCLNRNVKNIVTVADNIDFIEKENRDKRFSLSEQVLCDLVGNDQKQKKFFDTHGRADYVLVDIYKNMLFLEKFIFFLSNVTKDILIVRSESGRLGEKILDYCLGYGFQNICEVKACPGLRRSGAYYYIIDKRELLSSRGIESYKGNGKIYRKAAGCLKNNFNSRLWCILNSIFEDKCISRYYCKTFFYENKYIREFSSYSQWCKIKNLYETIKHIPYVQECDFSFFKKLISPSYDNNLLATNFNDDQKMVMKKQIISLLVMLNKAGVAHRDFHLGNLFYHDGKVVLTDLEFLEEDKRPLFSSYDVTGEGLESPLKSGNMHLFMDHPYSVGKFLGIHLDDLFLATAD